MTRVSPAAGQKRWPMRPRLRGKPLTPAGDLTREEDESMLVGPPMDIRWSIPLARVPVEELSGGNAHAVQAMS